MLDNISKFTELDRPTRAFFGGITGNTRVSSVRIVEVYEVCVVGKYRHNMTRNEVV